MDKLTGQTPQGIAAVAAGQEPATLGQLLTPQAMGEDCFRMPNFSSGWPRLFGGQVIGQALAAASATVGQDRQVNSLHAYFLRPGVLGAPIDCVVEREKDGGSFSNRRVIIHQGGKPILSMIASFHTGEGGAARDELQMPETRPPKECTPVDNILQSSHVSGPGKTPFELLEVRAAAGSLVSPIQKNVAPRSLVWVRFRDSFDADLRLAYAMIAYLSDLLLMETALQMHRDQMGQNPVVASIDHTVRFLADPDPSGWMLFAQESDWAGHGRTMIRGNLFQQDGRRIASISQEGLLRLN